MKQSKLPELQQRYRTALYSYFRITNLPAAYDAFLANPAEPPHFTYPKSVNEKEVKKRLANIRHDLADLGESDTEAREFLDRRLLETEILEMFLKLRVRPDGSRAEIKDYLNLQIGFYGKPSKELFEGIVNRLQAMAAARGGSQKFPLLTGLKVSDPAATLYYPKAETFQRFQSYFRKTLPGLHKVLDGIKKNEETAPVFERALAAIGAAGQGWKVEVLPDGQNINVSKHRKRVRVSGHWRPGPLLRLKQLVAHEIGCHVQRALYNAEGHELVAYPDEEGLAILCEQLMDGEFKQKRAMRYFALQLALGADGRPRNFSQTYQIVREAMQLIGYGGNEASRRAFHETARVFRGGFPELPGAVYIKDKVYLECSLKVWQKLEQQDISAKEFRSLFTGRDMMAKQEHNE
jgi:hypothetical protein